jgi:tetratricopeptide (TPR) repeat protein
MAKTSGNRPNQDALDELIKEITIDAYGDDEQLWAFRQVIEDEVRFPCDGSVMGQPVTVLEIDYDGNERRGLTARCRRRDGADHVVAAADVTFPERSNGARYLACYRKWLGLDPFPHQVANNSLKPPHPVTATDLDLNNSVELVVFSVKKTAMRCRLLGSDLVVTLRPSHCEDVVPGEIITVKPRKSWHHKSHPYLSGEIESTRLDATALGLVPLKLESWGIWTPEEHYWGEEGEPIEAWAKPIIASGARSSFEMEQVLPGVDPDDYDTDPISEASDLKEAGDYDGALQILMELCQTDLRCLDAHAHLGNLIFDRIPEVAIRHYEVGLRIGELSLGPDFEGLLPWGLIDNRPFLRCMHGYGLCLWRLGRFVDAYQIFERMLWLNPSDNQGVRFLIDDVRDRATWEECQDKQ